MDGPRDQSDEIVMVEAAECCIDAAVDGLGGLVSDLRWTSCDWRKAGNDADDTMKAAAAERVAAAAATARGDWDCAMTTRVRWWQEMKDKRMRSLSDSHRKQQRGDWGGQEGGLRWPANIPKRPKISESLTLRRASGTTPVIRRVSIHGVMVVRRRKAEVVGSWTSPHVYSEHLRQTRVRQRSAG